MKENYFNKSFAGGRERSTNQMHALDGGEKFIDLICDFCPGKAVF